MMLSYDEGNTCGQIRGLYEDAQLPNLVGTGTKQSGPSELTLSTHV